MISICCDDGKGLGGNDEKSHMFGRGSMTETSYG